MSKHCCQWESDVAARGRSTAPARTVLVAHARLCQLILHDQSLHILFII